jgi:hypothetical protein
MRVLMKFDVRYDDARRRSTAFCEEVVRHQDW